MNTMYHDLLTLCEEEDSPFYYVDQDGGDGYTYRIFLYRLARYSDFIKPNALEARGIMYRMSDEPELVCRPMEKFFNLNENPFTMGLDLSQVKEISVKEDGSLISTWIDSENRLRVKSKGSLRSDQALYASEYLTTDVRFYNELHSATLDGYTVNMEYVAPHNQIVIFYSRENLVVLNLRHRESGEYLERTEIREMYPYLYEKLVPIIETDDPIKFLTSVDRMNDGPENDVIEGFVFTLLSGQKVKVKTQRYLQLHSIRDSILVPGKLLELILYERLDDVKSSFYLSPDILEYITKIEDYAVHQFNHLVTTVEKYYQENKDKDRKEYAIGAREILGPSMCLAMNLYSGKPADFKAFAMKNKDQFLPEDIPN